MAQSCTGLGALIKYGFWTILPPNKNPNEPGWHPLDSPLVKNGGFRAALGKNGTLEGQVDRNNHLNRDQGHRKPPLSDIFLK